MTIRPWAVNLSLIHISPFSAVAGVGDSAAEAVAQAGQQGPYISIEDFRTRSGANSAVVQSLRELGVLDGLPETNQLCLF